MGCRRPSSNISFSFHPSSTRTGRMRSLHPLAFLSIIVFRGIQRTSAWPWSHIYRNLPVSAVKVNWYSEYFFPDVEDSVVAVSVREPMYPGDLVDTSIRETKLPDEVGPWGVFLFGFLCEHNHIDPHGPSSSSIITLRLSWSHRYLIILGSYFPYRGGRQQTCLMSPVSTWNT